MNKKNNISRIILDKYISGDLDEKMKKEIDSFMKTDETIRNRIHKIKKESYNFIKQFPEFENLSSAGKNKSKENRYTNINAVFYNYKFYRKKIAYLSIAILGFVLLMFSYNRFNHNKNKWNSQYSIKGNTDVHLIIKRMENIYNVKEDHVICQAFDTLQFVITSDKKVYYAIFSKGEKNQIIKHLPQNNIPLIAGTEKGEQVAASLIIEENSGDEMLFVVFSDSLFQMDVALKKIMGKNNYNMKMKKYFVKVNH